MLTVKYRMSKRRNPVFREYYMIVNESDENCDWEIAKQMGMRTADFRDEMKKLGSVHRNRKERSVRFETEEQALKVLNEYIVPRIVMHEIGG